MLSGADRLPQSDFWRCPGCGTENPEASMLRLCVGCGSRRPALISAQDLSQLPTNPASASAPRRSGSRVAWASWWYVASLAVLVALLHGLSDRWWVGSLLLFGPRWIAGIPLLAVAPAALIWRRKSLPILLLASGLLVGPLMGFRLPWRPMFQRTSAEPTIRVLTCNTQMDLLDRDALAALIERERPDVVLLQEWSGAEATSIFRGAGWHIRIDDQLLLGSRFPIREATPFGPEELGGQAWLVRYELATPGGPIRVHNVHLETAREGIEAVLSGGWSGRAALQSNIDMRSDLSRAASRIVAAAPGRSLCAGDFNLPGESAIFRRSWSGYEDSFAATGLGFGYTKHTRWFGARIDHVLVSPGMRSRRSWVGPDIGSDHRPLFADVTSGSAPE
ncbi:MAG: endonuclease/exonuclease/phosphatase [Planctomycetota bacterium]|nr:endonuclease/exonuclease/phosphatase [Planctomycetota bacterium]